MRRPTAGSLYSALEREDEAIKGLAENVKRKTERLISQFPKAEEVLKQAAKAKHQTLIPRTGHLIDGAAKTVKTAAQLNTSRAASNVKQVAEQVSGRAVTHVSQAGSNVKTATSSVKSNAEKWAEYEIQHFEELASKHAQHPKTGLAQAHEIQEEIRRKAKIPVVDAILAWESVPKEVREHIKSGTYYAEKIAEQAKTRASEAAEEGIDQSSNTVKGSWGKILTTTNVQLGDVLTRLNVNLGGLTSNINLDLSGIEQIFRGLFETAKSAFEFVGAIAMGLPGALLAAFQGLANFLAGLLIPLFAADPGMIALYMEALAEAQKQYVEALKGRR